jgi:hypothetical protein
MKMIQGIILTNNKILLSNIVEVMVDIGEPNCKLINPVEVTTEISNIKSFKRYLSHYTEDTEFMISSDNILTIFTPSEDLKEKYLSLIGFDDIEDTEDDNSNATETDLEESDD